MFDIGFSELVVIGIVALIVIGPERLPRVARTVGHLLGRAQRYVNDVKADINREIQLEELRKIQSELANSAKGIEDSLRQEFDATRGAVEDPLKEIIGEIGSRGQSAPANPATPASADPTDKPDA